MKAFKRIISSMLALVMFVLIFPLGVFAEGENDNIYSITNGYLTYSFNADTGGFAIETEEGNPKKFLITIFRFCILTIKKEVMEHLLLR